MTPEMIKDVYKVDKEGNLYIQKKESASLDPKKENYNVELDPLFKEQFEKESYFRLKTYDKKFFDQNYSGISERGYLLDLDGKETASLPSQNIAGKTGDLKKKWRKVRFTKIPEMTQHYEILVIMLIK